MAYETYTIRNLDAVEVPPGLGAAGCEAIRLPDRPELSALSFMLMAIILVGVIIYARVLGTEDLA